MKNWDIVYNSPDMNTAYNKFWNIYKMCYDVCFPLKRKRFNKNIHKKIPFMTLGLLVSRNTKNKLHKISLANPTNDNIQRYKIFKATYLTENAKKPKKMWETLNEILGKPKQKEPMSKINVDGKPESDPIKIANHFNSFFTSILGQKIADDV